MANSLTQWPTPPLPFTTGVRTNPIGWGFGSTNHASSSNPSTPHRPPLVHYPTTPSPQTQTGISFGSNQGQLAPPESEPRHQWGGPVPAPQPSSERKKRSRGSDTSSSSSITRAAKIASSRTYHQERSKNRRVHDDGEPDKTDDDRVDLGILLRTLPSTAHLPILLHLLKQDPTLQSSVMSQIPKPDLSECLAALDESRSKCRKALGVMVNVHVNAERRWTRALPEIEAHMRIANTYVSFFDSTQHETPLDPHVMYQLYHIMTRDIIFLLSYVPPNASTGSGPIKSLLDFAKTILDHWNTWLSNLSLEFNQQGGMWPRSIVEQWFDGIDAISNEQHAMWFGQSTDDGNKELVAQFRHAFAPFRGTFYQDLGWVLGRRFVE